MPRPTVQPGSGPQGGEDPGQPYDDRPPPRETIMTKAIRASERETAASYEQPAAGVPLFLIAGVILLAVLVLVGIFATPGASTDQAAQEGPGGNATAAVQVTMPAAELPTAPPATTEAPTPAPAGIALSNIGTETAAENKVSPACGEQQLVFSLMLRKRITDGRLEVTLVTGSNAVPIDAIYGNSNGSVAVPGSNCSLIIKWTGTSATYTVVGP